VVDTWLCHFLACGKAEHDGSMCWTQAAHLMVAGKQREEMAMVLVFGIVLAVLGYSVPHTC
jgi:predicted nucleic acid-binding Zn ribbon protein